MKLGGFSSPGIASKVMTAERDRHMKLLSGVKLEVSQAGCERPRAKNSVCRKAKMNANI